MTEVDKDGSDGRFKSKAEAKRTISQGGVRFNGVKITDPYHVFYTKDFPIIVEIGKKRKFILAIKDA